MFSKLRANFFTGAFIVIPVVITIWVLYFIVSKLNALFLDPVMRLIRGFLPISSAHNLELLTRIILFFALLFIITLIGFATRILIVRNIFSFGERLLYRVPMISNIYRAVKEISSSFFVQKKSVFQSVVMVEYPRKGVYQIGFVTSETGKAIREKTGRRLINVFIPTTPNPTSGMLVLVPENELIYLDITVYEGMKIVISGGASAKNIGYGDREDRGGALKEKRP